MEEKAKLKENELKEVSGGLRRPEGLVGDDVILIPEASLDPFEGELGPRAVFPAILVGTKSWEDLDINKQ